MNRQQEQGWSHGLATAVGERVRKLRAARGLSAAALSDRTTDLGHSVKRSVIAEMENGKRATVPLADVLVLARALAVPPVSLVYDLDSDSELLPGLLMSGWEADDWFTGEQLHGVAETIEDDMRDRQLFASASSLHRLKRELNRLAATELGHVVTARALDARARSVSDAAERTRLETLALRETELAFRVREASDKVRAALDAAGVRVPENRTPRQ